MAEKSPNPRTSVYMKPEVAAMARQWCAENRRSMSFLVEVAIREYLKRRTDDGNRERP